ncbi:MAG: stage II sporulation protein M, partial [Nitrosopumilus sp.]
MGLFTAAFQLGSMSEVNEDEANIFMKEFEKLVEDIDAIGIFLHNVTISLPMFIPGFGVAWGLFSAWSTGFAFAAIASVTPEVV